MVKSKTITNLSNAMKSYFMAREYGESLKEIIIGVVCVSPQFEAFFKIGKPIYTKEKKIRKIDFEVELEKTLEYRVKVDYTDFKNADAEKSIEILAISILNSLDVFDKVKITDFDTMAFKADLENCFKKMTEI
jgi:hypothetical protein